MELLLPSYPFLLALLVFLFMLLKIAKQNKANNYSPPGPWKLPLIGNMHQLIGGLPHRCLAKLAKRYGPLMQLRLGELSFVVVSSADTAKEMLRTYDINFASRPSLLGVNIIFYGTSGLGFAPYGDHWRQVRKICTMQLLGAKSVQSFRAVREEEVTNLIKSISSDHDQGVGSAPINLSKKIFSSISRIASRAAIGKITQEQEEFLSLIEDATVLIGGFNVDDLFPSVKLLPLITGKKRELEKIHSRIDKILDSIIVEHKAKKKINATHINNNGDVNDNIIADEDFVDVLLKVLEDGDFEFPFTITNIKSIILDMFSGGSSTSGAVVEWAISALLKNPRVMKKAQAEVRQVLNKEGRFVDEGRINELTYLNLVIKETLRLYPPGPLLLPRECREGCEINGYEIPVETKIIVNAWAIGRDSEYWNDAESFNPERFLDNSIDHRGNNFHYLPFGSGRRMCPGMAFGLANVELPLAQLLYHFDWKLPHGIKSEDLDMTEEFGASVKRKNDLYAIPIPYHHPSSLAA